jgi:hypothetical protein
LLNDRPPLLLRAIVHYADGRAFPVSAFAVHQRSLNGISDETVSGLTTAGDRVRKKRQAQAAYLAGLVQARETADPSEHLIVLGDFNAFDFNDGYVDPMGVVTGLPTPDDQTVVPNDGVDLVNPDLMNLHYLPEANKRYSYVFDGQAQSLDHILINQALGTDVTAYDLDHARMNADFPETNRNDANSPSRLSDHDPAIAYFAVPTVEHADMEMTLSVSPTQVRTGLPVEFTGIVSNHGPNDAANPGVGFAFDQALPDLQVTGIPSGWSCGTPQVSGDTTRIACNASTLASNTSATIVLKATSPLVFESGIILNAAAAATAETDDPDASNNEAQAMLVVMRPQADLSIGLAQTGVTTGAVANIRVPVANAGPDEVTNVHVIITADIAATPIIAKPVGWTCQRISGGTLDIECVHASAMPIGQETIAFSVVTPRNHSFEITASVYSTTTDETDPSDNLARYSTP